MCFINKIYLLTYYIYLQLKKLLEALYKIRRYTFQVIVIRLLRIFRYLSRFVVRQMVVSFSLKHGS